jgi:prevent-host-death family protein
MLAVLRAVQLSSKGAAVQVDILDAKNRLSELINSARAGEEVIIANRGDPVARLVPATKPGGELAGSAPAILEWLKRHALHDCARRSADDIESAIDEERASWG